MGKDALVFEERKRYERFAIDWLGGVPPNKYVSEEQERLIVNGVNFLLPKLKKYSEFMRLEYKTGTLLAIQIEYPADTQLVTFDLWYDPKVNGGAFGLRALREGSTIIATIIFPEEIWL